MAATSAMVGDLGVLKSDGEESRDSVTIGRSSQVETRNSLCKVLCGQYIAPL